MHYAEDEAIGKPDSDNNISGYAQVANHPIISKLVAHFHNAFPSRALALLLFIAAIDLISTSILYQKGLIVEVNPLMKVFIDKSNWLFIIVKASTLVFGWFFLHRYAKTHRSFVRNVCLAGSFAYLAIWVIGVLFI